MAMTLCEWGREPLASDVEFVTGPEVQCPCSRVLDTPELFDYRTPPTDFGVVLVVECGAVSAGRSALP
eukprot:3517504-Pyramimonas_sp.AAC.1